MKRWAVKQGRSLTTTTVNAYSNFARQQEVLTIFPSKRQAIEWRNTWQNKEQLEIVRVNIDII